jgi:hypothetical protein
MTDRHASDRHARYFSAMAILEAQMENLEVGDVDPRSEIETGNTSEQLTSAAKDCNAISVKDPRTASSLEDTSLSAVAASSGTENKAVKGVEEHAATVAKDNV